MLRVRLFLAAVAWGVLFSALPRAARGTNSTKHAAPLSLRHIERLFESGHYDSFAVETRRALRAALAQYDTALAAYHYVNRARSEMISGRNPAGLASLDTALTFARQAADTTLWMTALGFRGMALVGLGRHADALAAQRRRLGIARVVGNPRSTAWAYNYIGWGLIDAGHSDSAAVSFGAAAREFGAVGSPRGELEALSGLATARMSTGDIGRSRRALQRIVTLADSLGDLRIAAQTRNSLGNLELAYGDKRRALSLFVRSYSVLDSTHYSALAVMPLSNCAALLAKLGRRDDASRLYRRALGICDSLGMPNAALEMLDDIASLHLSQRRPAAAIATARRLLRARGATARQRSIGALVLGYALVARDSAAAALSMIDAFLGSDSVTTDIDAEMHAMASRACIPLGRHRRALRLARIADAQTRSMPGTVVRTRALCALALAQSACGNHARAVQTLRETRRAYREGHMATPDAAWRVTLEDAMYADLVDAGAVIYNALGVDSLWSHLEEVKGVATSSHAGQPGPERETLRTLQRVTLRPGELLLDVFVGRRMLWVLAVTPNAIHAHRLDVRRFEPRCRALRALLVSPPHTIDPRLQKTIGRSLAHTATDLLGPIRELVESSQTVIVSPDGFLHGYPFGAALGMMPDASPGVARATAPDIVPGATSGATPAATPGATSGATPAATPGAPKHAPPIVGYVPSAMFLANGRRSTPDPAERAGIVAIAPPKDAGLPGARGEVRDVARTFDHVRVVSSAADVESEVFAPIRPADTRGVLHVASHVSVHPEKPWESGILVRRGIRANPRGLLGTDVDTLERLVAAGGPGNRYVRAGSIARMQLPYRLVVLSACESAGGRFSQGRGVLGLSRAFLAAGTRTLVATLWPVDDAVTRRVMKTFYARLAAGLTVGAALQSACEAASKAPDTPQPFYWAGFAVLGDPSTRIQIDRTPHRNSLRAAAVTGIILLMGLGLRSLARRTGPHSRPRRRGNSSGFFGEFF